MRIDASVRTMEAVTSTENVNVCRASRGSTARRAVRREPSDFTVSTPVTVTRRTVRDVTLLRGDVIADTGGEVSGVTPSVRRDGGVRTAVWSVSVVSQEPPVIPPLASAGVCLVTREQSVTSPAAGDISGSTVSRCVRHVTALIAAITSLEAASAALV